MSENNTNEIVRQALHDRGICIIIPTYNNVGTIARVVNDALAYCDDVIVVDDGSNDGTGNILRALPNIHLVTHDHNRGKGCALKTGFKTALESGFAYTITLDADGQHRASDIPTFLEANRKHPGSLIMGSRQWHDMHLSTGSNFANKFSNFWFMIQTGRRLDDTQSGYRLYPLHHLHGLSLITSRYEAELELLVSAAWHGTGIYPVPINVYYPPREERVSHFRPGRDFARISLLNTLLCPLAIVYGLPLRLLHMLRTLLRTLSSFLVFVLAVTLVITPWAWLYVHIGKMTEKKRLRLHRVIWQAVRAAAFKIGIPGVSYHGDVSKAADLSRPSVIICNHQSHIDLLYLLTLSPHMVFLTKGWVWRNPFYGFLIRQAEFYPVTQGIDNLMPRLKSLVDRGYSIAVFPEGTRSRDLTLGRFHQGAFYIADRLGLGITPVCLYGTGHVMRKNTYHLCAWPVVMNVGATVSHERLKAIGTIQEQKKHFHRLYHSTYRRMADKAEQHV